MCTHTHTHTHTYTHTAQHSTGRIQLQPVTRSNLCL